MNDNRQTGAGAASAIPIGAITDEFSSDLDAALDAMVDVGLTGVELRVVWGRNILELDDDQIDRIRTTVASRGMRIVAIASPLLKCELPGAPPIDTRLQQDVFGSPYTFADQPRLTARALQVAEKTGAGIIRVFSYWRTVDPARCFDGVVAALSRLAGQAKSRGVVIGLENEPACNIGTAQETAAVLAAIDHPALTVVWDPANALVLGETAYPVGYRSLPVHRISHVHAKDCHVEGYTPEWGELGTMDIEWPAQIDALIRDGYRGWINLETHWKGPHGDKMEASRICGRRLRELVNAAVGRAETASC
jgi:L-ribulose-5-phosphate 3-epimerase